MEEENACTIPFITHSKSAAIVYCTTILFHRHTGLMNQLNQRLVGRSWINYKISVRSNCFPDDNQRNHPQSSLLCPLLQNIYRWGHLKFFFNYLTSSQWKGCCFLFTMPQATMTSHCRWMQIITVTGINTALVSYSTKLCQKSMGPIYKISYDLSQDYLKFIVNRDLR